jgi:hypothetical protein
MSEQVPSKEQVILWLHRINITGGLGMDAHAALDNALLYLRSAPEPSPEWQPIETAPKGHKLLVAYLNKLGNRRIVMARYYGEQQLESIGSESDDGYAPAGWYEECESQEDIMRTDEEPLVWHPLPEGPALTKGEG